MHMWNMIGGMFYLHDKVLDPVVGALVLGILLTVGFLCLAISLFVPKRKVILFISVVSFILYFALAMWAQNTNMLAPVLFILGLVFLFLELLIPGFGLPGIAGIALTLYGAFLAIAKQGFAFIVVAIALGISIVAIIVMLRKGMEYTVFSKLSLDTILGKKEGFSSSESKENYLGKEGMTETNLRPAGRILVEGESLDAISQGEFIPKETKVQVIRVEGSKIVVRRK